MPPFQKPRISISFSGGRTSAVMTKLALQKYSITHEIKVTFANTGQEHQETLKFIKRCDDTFRFNTIWLEAVVDPERGKGIRHRVVNYNTASRDGRPFQEYIAKYGIPNMASPQCTTRLKEDVMRSYLRSEGWLNNTFDTFIGIRADEADRQSARAKESRLVYPLIEHGWTKEKVIAEVRSWGFDLNIPEHHGNCTWCWKKSRRKLLTIAKNNPEFLDFPSRMEAEYSQHKTKLNKSADGRRLFFRGHLSTEDLFRMAKEPFEEFTDKHALPFDENLDFGVGCGESCEIGSDERYGVKIDSEETEEQDFC